MISTFKVKNQKGQIKICKYDDGLNKFFCPANHEMTVVESKYIYAILVTKYIEEFNIY